MLRTPKRRDLIHRYILLCTTAILAISGLNVFTSVAAHAEPPPLVDASYYVNSNRTDIPYAYGCRQENYDYSTGFVNSGVILDFGAQNSDLSGTTLINGVTISKNDIEAVAEEFIAGYNLCANMNMDGTSILFLGLGTNNSGNTSSAAGTAWAGVVDDINNWANNAQTGYPNVTIALGANDMENGVGWGTASATRAWADAYGNGLGRSYFDFGSANGCPTTSPPDESTNGSCDNGWTQEDEWYLAYGNYTGEPVPEIYVQLSAYQWALISKYGKVNEGTDIPFWGPMDEYPLDPNTNSAGEADTQLVSALENAGVDSSASNVFEIQQEPSSVSAENLIMSLAEQIPHAQAPPAKRVSVGYPSRFHSEVQRIRKRAAAWTRTHPGSHVSVRVGFDQARARNPRPSVRAAGINSEMHQGPFLGGTFATENFYQGSMGNSWFLVYAGATRNPAVHYPDRHGSQGRGALRIYSQPTADGPPTQVGTFSPASDVGPLRITKRQGSRLMLTSDRGDRLVFSLVTHEFSRA